METESISSPCVYPLNCFSHVSSLSHSWRLLKLTANRVELWVSRKGGKTERCTTHKVLQRQNEAVLLSPYTMNVITNLLLIRIHPYFLMHSLSVCVFSICMNLQVFSVCGFSICICFIICMNLHIFTMNLHASSVFGYICICFQYLLSTFACVFIICMTVHVFFRRPQPILMH